MNELAVVNDAAERGVKDTTEFANAARDGAMRSRIITVASSHSAYVPTLWKQELAKVYGVRLKGFCCTVFFFYSVRCSCDL